MSDKGTSRGIGAIMDAEANRVKREERSLMLKEVTRSIDEFKEECGPLDQQLIERFKSFLLEELT